MAKQDNSRTQPNVYYTSREQGFPFGRKPTWREAARLTNIRNRLGDKVMKVFMIAAGLEVPVTLLNDGTGIGVVDDGAGFLMSGAFCATALTGAMAVGAGIVATKFKTVPDTTLPETYNRYMAEPLPLSAAVGRYLQLGGKESAVKLAGMAYNRAKILYATLATATAIAIPTPIDDALLVPYAAAVGLSVWQHRNPFYNNPAANENFQHFTLR